MRIFTEKHPSKLCLPNVVKYMYMLPSNPVAIMMSNNGHK